MNTDLLDLNNDLLNIIGDYVKKDNFKKQLIEEEQVLNGKKIMFPCLSWYRYPYKEYEEYEEYEEYKE
jgi:hypothetical protein